MSHVVTPNFTPLTTARSVDSIWALTRSMKKAGWTVLASSPGTGGAKYTTGAYFASSATGADASTGAFSTPELVVTTPTGTFAPSNCGDFLEISGAASGGNNGRFIILTVNSATSVTVLNTAGVASDANNGSISWVLRPRVPVSAEDSWQIGVSLGVGAAGSLAAGLTPERMQVNGLSGLAATNVGDWLTLTGAVNTANNGTWLIARVLSASSAEVFARGSGSAYTGTIAWVLRQGTGANIGNAGAASITTKAVATDDDFIVTGLSHASLNSGVLGTVGLAPSYNTVEINNLTGITTDDEGRWLTISGAANAGNNGEWLIVKYLSATSVRVLNPTRVASDANFVTWSIRRGPEEGNFLCINGAASDYNNGPFQIVKTLGPTSCWLRIPFGVVLDANNGAISWTQKDPTGESLLNLVQWGPANWILMRGPGMLRVPFITGISGASTYLPGEKVTQTATGAEGELEGVTIDSAGIGWLVINPQVKGSGSYDFGWNLTAIVGSSSSASITPTGIQEFQRELVFYAQNHVTDWLKFGYSFVGFTRKCSEQRQQFWIRSLHAGCTNAVAPGFTSTTDTDANTFPSIATYAALGVVNGGHDYFHRSNYDPSVTPLGKTQIICANAIRRQNQSADGSFTSIWYVNGATVFSGFSFQRVDNQEEGEVDPWVFYSPAYSIGGGLYTPSRTGNVANYTGINTFIIGAMGAADDRRAFLGTRARGTGVDELPSTTINMGMGGLWQAYNADAPGLAVAHENSTFPETIASSVTVGKRFMEPIGLVHITTGTTRKFRKGTLRWMFAHAKMGAVGWDTWADKQYLVTCTGSTTSGFQPTAVGPWDGKTTPVLA